MLVVFITDSITVDVESVESSGDVLLLAGLHPQPGHSLLGSRGGVSLDLPPSARVVPPVLQHVLEI